MTRMVKLLQRILPSVAPEMVVAAAIAAIVAVTWGASGAAAKPQPAAPLPNLMDEMRMPWQRPEVSFLRHWLLCGDFPNPNASGLERDFLQEQGGEERIRPTKGMTIRRPDGTVATWTEINATDDVINLLKAFPGRPINDVVAYGFTTVDWPRTEQAVLSLGSDDGVKVWLNGRMVWDHPIRRGVRKDEDQVEVPMTSSQNTLLVKVEQGGGDWGFAVRILSHAQLALMSPHAVSFSIPAPDLTKPDDLTIKLDSMAAAKGLPEGTAKVEIVAPGGHIMETREAPGGSELHFNASRWPEEAYDVRASATSPGGGKSVAYGMWYHGDPRAAARRLVLAARDADPSTQVGMVETMLAALVKDRMGRDLDEGLNSVDPNSLPSLYSALMEWEELQMDEGRGGVRPNGFIRLAYRDPVDNSPQFCRAYLPPDYTPDRKWPMVVHLHGYNADNPPYVRWGIDGRHHGWSDNYGVIALEPLGRYNTTYWGIGEKDVVRCVQLAKEQLSVDDDRVYLVGESMGGGGCWYVGTRHPELFAALAPEFGGRDLHADLTADQAAQLSPHDRYRFEARSMFVQAESLLTTPVFVNHGDRDDLVKVEYSRYAVRMLQRWGYNIRYWEHPGYGHGGFYVDDDLMRWFLQQRRVNPSHVRLHAADISTASAHWVRVEQGLDPWKLVDVDAAVTAPNVIRLDTNNVARLTLSPDAALIDPAKSVQVVWNGDDLRSVDLSSGHVTLDVAGYAAPDGEYQKTPQRWGRMDDVFRTPFAIIVGTTSPDPLMRRFVQRAADRYRSWWRQWQHVYPPVIRDTDLSDKDLARYSLVLIGGPEENAVTRRLADRLPLKVFPDGFRIDGRSFPATNAVVQMVYPHPENPARYVAVIAANSPAGMFLSDRLPGDMDFTVVDGRMPQPTDPESKVRVAGGQFDNGWHFQEAFLETGDPGIRARCPLRKVPKLLTAAVDARKLMLGEVVANSTEGTFTAMAHDQNWYGEQLELRGKRYRSGIAVQTAQEPCSATYNLSGDGWRRLRATIGVEVDAPKLTQIEKDNTLVQFVVNGDGHELYKSPMLHWDSKLQPIDVDIRDVRFLTLRVISGSTFHNAARSVDWADLQLER